MTVPATDRLRRADLHGKLIDIHSHAGVSLKAYACQEYPYACTVDDLYYRQLAHGVDLNVVFPFSADLHFDPLRLAAGRNRPARRPLSAVPYGTENELLLREVFEFCPEHRPRFLPFVSVDPARSVPEQVEWLERLAGQFPIYGIKINPVLCQSKITALLGKGAPLLELAARHDWPLLLHTTPHAAEAYSRADLSLRVIRRHPELRFCLAHCIGFHRGYLDEANALPNVWVDTAALAIQVQAAAQEMPIAAAPRDRVPADYSDPADVLRVLVERYPQTMIWGSDTPAYAYICRRQQAEGVWVDFRLKARYEDEVAALRSLPVPHAARIGNTNSLDFLCGVLQGGPSAASPISLK